MFPNAIRIAEIQSWIGYGAKAVTNSHWMKICGIKADGTEVDLGTNNSGDTWGASDKSEAKRTHTVSAANQKIEFVGIMVRRVWNGGAG